MLFTALDTDGDGFLQPDEFAAMKENDMIKEHIEDPEDLEKFCNFEACDADGDGKVSQEEFWAHGKRAMKKKVLKMINGE